MLDGIEKSDADWWSEAGAPFRRSIGADIRRRQPDGKLPWERSVSCGQPEYFRIHACALDRLAEFLARILPHGVEFSRRATEFRGQHDEHANPITVSLMTGAWADPRARRRGTDLVSLVAHVYRMPKRRAARLLGQWLGIEGTRDV